MGIFDAILDPNKNTNRAYGGALSRLNKTGKQTNPFLRSLVDGGEQGNSYLMDLMGYGANSKSVLEGLMNNPAYQSQLKAGLGGIDASAAARGMSQSGDTIKALDDHGQRSYGAFRQREIGNAFNQMGYGMKGVGGLNQGTNQYNQLLVGQGQAQDAGNAGAMGNIIGIGGTIASLATGLPSFGGGKPMQLGGGGGFGGGGGGGFGRVG